MNTYALNQKYKGLIPHNVPRFVKNVNDLKKKVDFSKVYGYSALIYSDSIREAVQYSLCMYNSLKAGRILDYVSVTASTIAEQHFNSNEDRDKELMNDINYVDILFIKLSQFDNTNGYVESLIIDLIEFRTEQKKLTFVIYDTMGAANKQSLIVKKVHTFFRARDYIILTLNGKDTIVSQFSNDESSSKTDDTPVGVVRRGAKR